ncbi:KGK domain-containing protein [Alkalinema pantanalense CENA528]|uniref:KGK domain-containing protein n=1 Tax=Alkalinema pantanalense TaxID=1620705 RepID=UPI003D6E7A74
MNSKLEFLTQDDVITVDKVDGVYIMAQSTFRHQDWIANAEGSCGDEEYTLYTEGVACEILRPGQPWQKGKLKLVLAFCPDEPETELNDLDQIRQFQLGE